MTKRGFDLNTGGVGNQMGHNEKYTDNYYVTLDASANNNPAKNPIRQEQKEKFTFGRFSLL